MSDNKLRQIGRFCGGAASHFVGREKSILNAQLVYLKRHYPNFRDLNPAKLTQDIFRHLGESVAENLIQEKLLERKSCTETAYPDYVHIRHHGKESFMKLQQSGKAFLAMSAHLGNFELLGAVHAQSLTNPTVIGREPNYKFISTWIKRLRRNYGAHTLLRPQRDSSSYAVTRELIKAFRGTGVIALLPDQDTKLESEFAPFFGVDAGHPAAPIRRAVRCNVPVITSFIVRTAPFEHTITSEEIKYDWTSPTAERDILTEYNRRLEKFIVAYPEQYLWFHRRWRRRPGVDYDKEPERLLNTVDYTRWISAHVPESLLQS